MTNALPLWTIRGPQLGSWKWLNRVMIITLVSVALILVGCSFASFIASAEEDLPVVMQMITNITNVVAPAVSAEIVTIGGLTLAGMQILCGNPPAGSKVCDPTSLIGQYQAAPTATLLQKIQAALQAVNTHLTSMISLANANGSSAATALVVGVGLALSTLTMLIGLIPSLALAMSGNLKAAATTAKKSLKGQYPQRASQLKASFNAVMIGHAFPTAVIQ